jgi:hypothetical protein
MFPPASATLPSGLPLSLRGVFYAMAGHAELAQWIERVIEDIVALLSIDRLNYYFDLEGEPVELDRGSLNLLLDTWLRGELSQYPNATIELVGYDGEISKFGIQYFGRERIGDEVSFLSFWMPASFFNQHKEATVKLFHDINRSLPVSASYLSLALVGGSQTTRQSLAVRFRGLDIANPECVQVGLGAKVPGVYWLNFWAECTGVNPFDAKFPDVGERYVSARGFVVGLSIDPSLLDKNRLEDDSHYRKLAHVIAAEGRLYIPTSPVYFVGEGGLADLDAQIAWHGRFLDDR